MKRNDNDHCWSSLMATTETTTNTARLLLELVKLPLDRLQLQTGGLISGVYGREILIAGGKNNNDLQEEEQTHMMLLAPPAEHRSSYGSGGHAYVHDSGHPTGQAHGEPIPAEYQAGGASEQPDPQMAAPGVGSSSSEHQLHQHQTGVLVDPQSARPPPSALQTRSDLPAVRALNVKCEKNYMMVSVASQVTFI